jgi:hypothetical protein
MRKQQETDMKFKIELAKLSAERDDRQMQMQLDMQKF